MIRRVLGIGRWIVEFYFAPDGFDIDTILDRMFDFGAPVSKMRQALDLMESGESNSGFTYTNPYERLGIVAIGPTTSGSEFQDTFVHEVKHLATEIAASIGVDLRGETPAYIAGDSARELADIVCHLGCDRCRG